MMKFTLILSLAVVALATKIDYDSQVVRLGSVGSTYSYFKGVLVPYTKHMVKGIPAYEVQNVVKGMPVPAVDLINFRCHHVEDHLLPADTVNKPVYLCRNLNLKKDSTSSDKLTFLFSAMELKTIPMEKEIDLWIGRAMSHELISGVPTRMYDDTTDHLIRFGSIGTKFAHFKGSLLPYTTHVTENIPAFELRSLVNGIAKQEEQLFNFRCGLLEYFYMPIETETKPVYMCRHINPVPTCPSQKKSFLFTAEKLNIEPGKKMIDLWLGRNMWEDFVTDVYSPSVFQDEAVKHEIRIGSIGTHFADLRGVLVPYTKGAVEGIPCYELQSIVKDVPVIEHDRIGFRCHCLDEFYVPIKTISKPVYLCQSHEPLRDITAVEKTVFLFSAENLNIPVTTKTFDLWLGRNLWREYTSEVYTKA